MLRFFKLFILTCCINSFANAQFKVPVENLPKYDQKPYHFGFSLGLNQMNFIIHPVDNVIKSDTLLKLEPITQWGFNIGIISNLRLGKYTDLRFIPGLAFGDRKLEYRIIQNDTLVFDRLRKIESTFIELPLMFKYKSARLGNMRAYVFGGSKYSFDLASLSSKKNKIPSDEIVKLKRDDVYAECGVGFDFYMYYFKFAIEAKMSYGFKDMIKRDGSFYTNSIDRLNSKIFLLSFLFE